MPLKFYIKIKETFLEVFAEMYNLHKAHYVNIFKSNSDATLGHIRNPSDCVCSRATMIGFVIAVKHTVLTMFY